ncbi:MAG: hypothetical protein LBV72_01945 [Tannerella sp.]|nr:hypothetical protein [Tannerella sp.]
MKRTIISLVFAVIVAALNNDASAQIQKGNLMVGGDLGNLNWGMESKGTTSLTFNPKVGWFIQDGLVVGIDASLGFVHVGDGGANTFSYGLGGFGRYYITDDKIEVIKRTKFFFEANAGIQGQNQSKGGADTNGLGFGFGPGFTYFLTDNVGLEASVKYNGVVGFGSEAYQNNLILNVGFQIYLPGKAMKNKVKSDFSK